MKAAQPEDRYLLSSAPEGAARNGEGRTLIVTWFCDIDASCALAGWCVASVPAPARTADFKKVRREGSVSGVVITYPACTAGYGLPLFSVALSISFTSMDWSSSG